MSSDRFFFFFLSGEQLVSVGVLFKSLPKKLVLYFHLINEKEGVRGRKECAQEKKKSQYVWVKNGTSI